MFSCPKNTGNHVLLSESDSVSLRTAGLETSKEGIVLLSHFFGHANLVR